ncbi:MAG: class I adenylate-forming enzyme family protein [Solirubrobacterales bacterium]
MLGGDLRASATRYPDKDALIAGELTLTYRELDQAADRVAAGLAHLGVRRGDRVAVVLPNGAEAAMAIYGVLRAGAAFSPLNPTIKEDKLAYVLSNSGARAVLCDGDRAEVVKAAVAHGTDIPVVTDVAELSSDGAAVPVPPVSIDLAGLIYTSGSTGDPKGVTLTHANMAFAADSIIEYLEMIESDRVLCVLPLSFDYGLFQMLMCVRVAATLVLEPGFTFPGRVVQLLEEQRITGLPGVPTVFQVLTALRGLAERELPDLRYLSNTGAALPAESIEAIRKTFPNARLYSMYGLTECKRVSYLPPEQLDERITSVGIPIPGTEAWIEDDEGRVAGPGEVGELMVRGAHVMQGYWGDEKATAERLRPGRWPWERVLATGDLFRSDEEGYLYFVGRRDDIIKSRGEKVAPREVEDVLHSANGVREAAVVGIPDRLLGQAIHAHVSPQEGHDLDPGELKRVCAEHLEDFMVPQQVVVHDELPRTSNGKIDRLSLARA